MANWFEDLTKTLADEKVSRRTANCRWHCWRSGRVGVSWHRHDISKGCARSSSDIR